MILIIELDVNDITIKLKDKNKIIGQHAWTGEFTLNEKLLPEIDKLLRKNKVKKQEIEKITAKISKTSGVTSTRIVKTLVKAWTSGKSYAIIDK